MKFIKKPIPIDAVKCIKKNEAEIIRLLNSGKTDYDLIKDGTLSIVGYDIHSWEGVDPVYYDPKKNSTKDHPNGAVYWVIRGIKGEIYPCIEDDNDDAPLGYEPYKGD